MRVGVRPALNVATLTESIQDTSPRIHSESRLRTGEIKNLYPIELAPRIYPWGQSILDFRFEILDLRFTLQMQSGSLN